MKKFLYGCILFCLLACQSNPTTDKQEEQGITILQDGIKTTTNLNSEKQDEYVDPQFAIFVKDALQKVDSLYKGEENWQYTDSITKTTVKAGKFFNNQPYAVVHIDYDYIETLVEVYKIEENRTFRKKLSYIDDFLFAVHDSIFDANGDGINDFNIDWWTTGAYGASIIYIYLFNPETENFSTPYEFANATFYPKEKLIRGVEEGFGGKSGLYKMKWIGDKSDKTEDIEYIYPDYTTKGKTFIRMKTQSEEAYPERNEGELLKKVSEEYADQKEWFLRYQDKELRGELPFLELILKDRKKK
ncbi:hypothetical protein RCZ04_23230 [Capnocytophaga sp. HP1101]